MLSTQSAPSLAPILLIDDSEDDRFFLKRLLKKAGVANPTLSFDDAREAVKYLERGKGEPEPRIWPSVIFTDLKMPSMSGFEFAEWLRNQAPPSYVWLVVVSGSNESSDRERAIALGAKCYFVKFPLVEALAAMVGLAVEGSRRAD